MKCLSHLPKRTVAVGRERFQLFYMQNLAVVYSGCRESLRRSFHHLFCMVWKNRHAFQDTYQNRHWRTDGVLDSYALHAPLLTSRLPATDVVVKYTPFANQVGLSSCHAGACPEPVLYIVPITQILGRLPLVPAGGTGTIPHGTSTRLCPCGTVRDCRSCPVTWIWQSTLLHQHVGHVVAD